MAQTDSHNITVAPVALALAIPAAPAAAPKFGGEK
jgi:hypothetical protein